MAWKHGKPSMQSIRQLIAATIRYRMEMGFLVRYRLHDEAFEKCKIVEGEEQLISELDHIISDGTYWHWTDSYARAS